MIAKLLRTRRTRQLAQAMNRCDVPRMIELVSKGVDLDNFQACYADAIPHASDNVSSIHDPLLWAAMCHVPAAGFEVLLDAGAKLTDGARSMVATYAQAKGAGPWKEAPQVEKLILRADAVERGVELDSITPQATGTEKPGRRL